MHSPCQPVSLRPPATGAQRSAGRSSPGTRSGPRESPAKRGLARTPLRCHRVARCPKCAPACAPSEARGLFSDRGLFRCECDTMSRFFGRNIQKQPCHCRIVNMWHSATMRHHVTHRHWTDPSGLNVRAGRVSLVCRARASFARIASEVSCWPASARKRLRTGRSARRAASCTLMPAPSIAARIWVSRGVTACHSSRGEATVSSRGTAHATSSGMKTTTIQITRYEDAHAALHSNDPARVAAAKKYFERRNRRAAKAAGRPLRSR